jgi:hypothetical protein
VPDSTCRAVGSLCHANMNETGPGVQARGRIEPGPCARPVEDCVEFPVRGSFGVRGLVAGLPPGSQPLLEVDTVNAAAQFAGIREVPCDGTHSSGTSICVGAVPQFFPQVGGFALIRGQGPPPTIRPLTPTPTRTPTPTPGRAPVPPPLPPVPLLPPFVGPSPAGPPLFPPPLPPPSPLLPPPPPGPGAGAEVPIIPEASSLWLLALGAVGVGLAWRLKGARLRARRGATQQPPYSDESMGTRSPRP